MHDSPDTLWRYMKLSTFLLLLEGKAWFPSVASLRRSDPLEAALGDEFYEKLWRELECQDGSEKAIAWLSTIRDWEDGHPFESGSSIFAQVYGKCVADDIATRRAAWCWFKSEHESAAMWPIYGHQGVAVMTDLEGLRASLPKEKEFRIQGIEYVDRRPCAERSISNALAVQPDRILQPYFLKAIEYQHEQEVRVVAHCPEGAKGLMVAQIDPKQLIREVVVSPLLPPDEAEAVERIIHRSVDAGCFPIKRSSLVIGDFGYDFMRAWRRDLHGSTDANIDSSDLPAALRNL